MTIEPALRPPPKSQDRRRTERHADDMLEDWPVAVPANARAGVVASHQDLHERRGIETRERGGGRAQVEQPVGDRHGLAETRIVEVIMPAERGGLALAGPALEAERRDRDSPDRFEQRRFLRDVDQLFDMGKPVRQRRREKIGLAGQAPRSDFASAISRLSLRCDK